MQKITNDNLEPYVGNFCELYVQVGVVASLTGTLLNGYGLCRWGIELSNGQRVGFGFGQFKVLPNKTVSIQIS